VPALRPFFSYYGSKWTLVRRGVYPEPRYDAIIEPFAGSAAYSLHNWDLDVILCDRNPSVVGVWRFLIEATAEDILAMPVDYRVAMEELSGAPRDLVGFWLAKGRSRPATAATAWMKAGDRPGSFWGEHVREKIASQVERISHWRVFEGDYRTVENGAATWFVDPPYQGRPGRYYGTYGSAHLDYEALGRWCRSLEGQVVVCEEEGAGWLPFEPAGEVRSIQWRTHREASWVSPSRA